MKSLFKTLSLLIAITCLVWLAVLWHWQSTQRDMSARDLVMYLGALPLVLFVVVLGGRWAFVGIDERTTKRREAKVGATGASPALARSAGEVERFATMRVLGAHLNTLAGTTIGDLAAAIGQRRPSLDRELLDGEGMPVIAARIDGLDATNLSPPLGMFEQLARHRDSAWAAATPSPALGRALAALVPCLDGVFADLGRHRDRLGAALGNAASDDLGSAAAPINPSANPPPDKPHSRVLVYVAWPSDATPFDRAVADLWLHRTMDERREGICAAGRILRPATEAPADGPSLLQLADEAMQRMRQNATDDLVLLLAAESHIDEACVQRWQRDGLLCTSRQPKGLVPGEGAAALLLAPSPAPSPKPGDGKTDGSGSHADADDDAYALLHRPALAARDKSIDGIGRVDPKVASLVAEQALAASGLGRDAIAALACDSDQATPRGLEAYGVMQALLPHLDAASDVALTGTVCGSVGSASTLIAVALAAKRAVDDTKPCLALGVGDPLSRVAVVARSSKEAAAGASATPAAGAPA